MNKLPNKRNFDYDMKKLLGLEQPPIVSEVVLTISGLTDDHLWAGLGNGTNYEDIEERFATESDRHYITFKDPNITNKDTHFGYISLGARQTDTNRVLCPYFLGYMKAASSSTRTSDTATINTTNIPTSMTALWYYNGHSFNFTHMGDSVTLTISKGSAWSKGNM